MKDMGCGTYLFEGAEEDIAFRWMWGCLLDMSFWGRVKLTWHIWRGYPPKRYFEDLEKHRR